MKKICAVIVSVLCLGGLFPECSWAESELWDIPVDVLRPVVEEGETMIMQDDFEGNPDLTYTIDGQEATVGWSAGEGEKVDVIGAEGGNHIAKLADPNGWPSLGWGSWFLDNSVLKFNMRVDYDQTEGAGWIQIAKLRMRWGDDYAKIMLYHDPQNTSGEVIYEQIYKANGQTQSSNWTTVTIENFDEVFRNQWNYWQFVMYEDKIVVYLNDTETPLMVCNYYNPNGIAGALGFENGNANLYMDNFLVVKKDYTNAPVPEIPDDRKVLYWQDFEDYQMEPEDLGGCYKLDIWNEIWSFGGSVVNDGYGTGSENGAYNFKGEYISKDLELFDFCMEFNIKIDAPAAAWPEFSWNRMWTTAESKYKSYFDTSAGILTLLKVVNGAEDWDTLQMAPGPGIMNVKEMNDKWAYMKIERVSNVIKIYYNDKENPCLIVTDPGATINSGGIKIADGGANKMYIDNLLISVPKKGPDFEIAEHEFQFTEETPGKTTVTANLSVFNRGEDTVASAVLLAAYDAESGILCQTAQADVNEIPVTEEDAPYAVPVSMTLDGPAEGYSYKVFIWDSLNEMKPLWESIPYGAEETV